MKRKGLILLIGILMLLSVGPVQAAPNQQSVTVSQSQWDLPKGHLLESFALSSGQVVYLATSMESVRGIRLYELTPQGAMEIASGGLSVDAQPERATVITQGSTLTVILNWPDGETQGFRWEMSEPFAEARREVIYLPFVR